MAHALAGQPAPRSLLVNVPRLVSAYYSTRPDPGDPAQRVTFGTSGHRGSSLRAAFNEAHVLAIAQAVCDYRRGQGIDGPLYVGLDTHALSEPARISVLEVLAANEVTVCIDHRDGYTPTPAVSFAILEHNRGRERGLADGLVLTPSHNPPEDGGIKYNPPHGGPAGNEVSQAIQRRANELLEGSLDGVRRVTLAKALAASTTQRHDYIGPYVAALPQIVDMEVIRSSGLKIGVDPMGGSGLAYWAPIVDAYGLDLTVVNEVVDPTFSFMRVDKDGKIRMDCSSPHAMAGLAELRDRFDIAFGNDTDYDRHGIVTRDKGLLNPNHYLAVAIEYLFRNRPQWSAEAMIGKTLVSSSMIDRVAADVQRPVSEVPVGFKWFVEGLGSGRYAFAGEESAGASFLRMTGESWSTDKDGIIMDLLAAEITARTGQDPGQRYQALTERFGAPLYERIDAPANPEQKAVLKNLSPSQVPGDTLAGEPITAKLTEAPGNGAAIGGLKVTTENGWFAARPSGTENVYKIYTESFVGADHLAQIQEQAQAIVGRAFEDAAG